MNTSCRRPQTPDRNRYRLADPTVSHDEVLSTVDPARNGYYFDKEAILTLRHIEDLRTVCRNDLAVVKMILDLTNEVERLNSKMRSLSQNSSTWKRSLKSNQRRKTK